MEQNQQKLEQSTNNFCFLVKSLLFLLKLLSFFVQVSPSMTRSGVLVEGVYLFERAVKFSDTVFVASFDFFPYVTGALSCGFKSSFIFFSFS